jgi:O-acetyl-ADP-ribose deacetylase (regulator of RNase III)
MIDYVKGDLLQADVEALVNTVNCVGVMGAGIAAQFKQQFPENYRAYMAACKKGMVRPGSMFMHPAPPPRTWIINFPTKRHYAQVSWIEDIALGLTDLVQIIHTHQIQSIAIPALGCGLGGLSWDMVRPLMEQAFHALLTTRICIFEPGA